MSSRVGSLLISHPNVPAESIFYKSVIYVYSDSPSKGTLGLVVNKPTRYAFAELAASRGWDIPLTRDYIRIGGPVNEQALLLLHTDDWRSTNTTHIKGGICLTSDEFMIEKISYSQPPAYWRIMGGVCSWAPGQLDMELQGQPPYRPENSWLTATTQLGLLFEVDGERQWEKAVELSSQQMINQYF